MDLHDPVSITRVVQAIPFREAPSIFIAYPDLEDWKKLYHPQPLRMPDATGIYRNVDLFEERYRDMKRSHETEVMKRLRMIAGYATGRAVLNELTRRRSYSVCIFPFDFMPSGEWELGTGALAETIRLRQAATKRPPVGMFCDSGACALTLDHSNGQAVDLFYTRRNWKERDADCALLHELVHATRITSGTFHGYRMGRGYGNTEEFLAQTIENIYRSEKKMPLYDYNWRPLEVASFFDRKQEARAALYEMQNAQRLFFDELAIVKAGFNPVKVLYDEVRRVLTTNPFETGR